MINNISDDGDSVGSEKQSDNEYIEPIQQYASTTRTKTNLQSPN